VRGAISNGRPYRDSYSGPEVSFEEVWAGVAIAGIDDGVRSSEIPQLPNRRGLGSSGVGQWSPRVWRLRTRNGQVIQCEILARPVEWEGRAAVLVVVVSESGGQRWRDITTALRAASAEN
jgi:hypothetical protein